MNMKEYITKDTVNYYARTNEKFITVQPKGIILEFPGLGGGSCLGGCDSVGDYDSEFAIECAGLGVILAYVFAGPWSWMNESGVRIADAVVDALCDKYSLADPVIVASGGSMGGQGALIYSLRSSHKMTACCAACPCLDIPEAVYANPNFPRAFISAVAGYGCESLSDALLTISPIHNTDNMPDIQYFISVCCEDEVFPETTADRYTEIMTAAGHSVECVKMPGQKHGYFSDEGISRLRDFEMKFFR